MTARLIRNLLNLLAGKSGLMSSTMSLNKAKILYSSEGRYGHVHYRSSEASFAMYYEYGGGDCVACIDILDSQKWQAHTGLPLERRDAVLDFIGQQVVKDQTTGGRGSFRIEKNWLNIYSARQQ